MWMGLWNNGIEEEGLSNAAKQDTVQDALNGCGKDRKTGQVDRNRKRPVFG